MAVPGRVINEDEENNDENGLFEEFNAVDFNEIEIPLHLRALASASQLGHVDALRLALDNLEGSIDQPIEDGDTALHLSCLYGHLPCVQLLLERGANLEAKDEDGALPLHDACAGGYTEIVQLLINRATGSECLESMLESVDAEGDTPLHHAARGEHVAVIKLLLVSGASLTSVNLEGKIPCEMPDPSTDAGRFMEAALEAYLELE